MRKFCIVIFVLGLFPSFHPKLLHAATYVSLLDFANPFGIVDRNSGNHINEIIDHPLDRLPNENLILNAATLSLIHKGNLDDGPVREVWTVLDESGFLIGKLSESNREKVSESWQLSEDILAEISASNPKTFSFAFQEETPYNNEKFELYQSRLQVEYDVANTKAPLIPEPSALWLMILGLSGVVLKMRISKSEIRRKSEKEQPLIMSVH